MAVRWPHISSNLIRKSDFMCTVLRSDIHSTPWLKATYPDNNYVWQQNGAPAHTSKTAKKFSSTNMASFWSKDVWLLSSYDFKPLDIFGGALSTVKPIMPPMALWTH